MGQSISITLNVNEFVRKTLALPTYHQYYLHSRPPTSPTDDETKEKTVMKFLSEKSSLNKNFRYTVGC